MRSTDTNTSEQERSPAARFGAWFTKAALAAGYDTTPGSGGRAALAAATGMSPSSVGRTVEGRTLPMPSQFEGIARALRVDVRTVLVEAGIISPESWTETADVAVRSQSITPEHALDSLGVTDPTARAFALAAIEQAIAISKSSESGRGAAAEG